MNTVTATPSRNWSHPARDRALPPGTESSWTARAWPTLYQGRRLPRQGAGSMLEQVLPVGRSRQGGRAAVQATYRDAAGGAEDRAPDQETSVEEWCRRSGARRLPSRPPSRCPQAGLGIYRQKGARGRGNKRRPGRFQVVWKLRVQARRPHRLGSARRGWRLCRDRFH